MLSITPWLCLALSGAFIVRAADWPQYRGPNHDGLSTEMITDHWPAGGPVQAWKTPLNAGFSSFAVGAGKVFTLVTRPVEGTPQEVCVALDANTGKEVWMAALGVAKFDGGGDSGTSENKGGDGPRSTPSVDGDRVYTFSSRLVLSCLDEATGQLVWRKDLIKEHAGRNISWQSAVSPLIEGDLVIVFGGGEGQSLLAFNKKDGRVVWKGQNEKLTHATPVAVTILDVRQVIFFTQSGLVSVRANSGEVLWRFPFRYNVSTGASPVVSGDIVYCSAGYGIGASACRVTKTADVFAATPLWNRTAKELNSHWSTPVVKDGYLYGLFGFKEYGQCPLKCVELATGREVWSEPGFGPGGCLWVDGKLLVLSDAGHLVCVAATPERYSEIARADVLGGKCWSSPALSNGRLYLRSTTEGVCLKVGPAQTAAR